MTDKNKEAFKYVSEVDEEQLFRSPTEWVENNEGEMVLQKNTTTFAPGKLPFHAPAIVAALNGKLQGFIDRNWITMEEADALRHYYGTREMAKNYGGVGAQIVGAIHEFEWPNLIGESHPQNEVDKINNSIALEHYNNNIGTDWSDDLNIKDLKLVLENLIIPPNYDLPEEEQKKYVDDAIFNLYNNKDATPNIDLDKITDKNTEED